MKATKKDATANVAKCCTSLCKLKFSLKEKLLQFVAFLFYLFHAAKCVCSNVLLEEVLDNQRIQRLQLCRSQVLLKMFSFVGLSSRDNLMLTALSLVAHLSNQQQSILQMTVTIWTVPSHG